MTDEKKERKAREVYETMCEALDAMKIENKRNEETMNIVFSVKGAHDILLDFCLRCDADKQMIRLIVLLPFEADRKKMLTMSIATSHANYMSLYGSFDYDLKNGTTVYRMCTTFRSSVIGEELIKEMVNTAREEVDEFADNLMKLAGDKLSLEDFMKKSILD